MTSMKTTPLQRCGARTRTGAPCSRKPVPGKRRCRNHGGLSTGPKSPEAKERLRQRCLDKWQTWYREHPGFLERKHAEEERKRLAREAVEYVEVAEAICNDELGSERVEIAEEAPLLSLIHI